MKMPDIRMAYSKALRSRNALRLFDGFRNEFSHVCQQFNSSRATRANPFASMLFYWPHLTRQVRVEGRIKRLSREESDAYFQMRPIASRMAIHASGILDYFACFSEESD